MKRTERAAIKPLSRVDSVKGSGVIPLPEGMVDVVRETSDTVGDVGMRDVVLKDMVDGSGTAGRENKNSVIITALLNFNTDGCQYFL